MSVKRVFLFLNIWPTIDTPFSKKFCQKTRPSKRVKLTKDLRLKQLVLDRFAYRCCGAVVSAVILKRKIFLILLLFILPKVNNKFVKPHIKAD